MPDEANVCQENMRKKSVEEGPIQIEGPFQF